MTPLVDYITSECKPDIWLGFLSKNRGWTLDARLRLIAIFCRMVEMFKVLLQSLPCLR